MTEKRVVRHAIEELYGPCPVGDPVRANAWAEAIDWEVVRDKVEAEHPDFRWPAPHHTGETDPAEVFVFHVRSEMLHHAGQEEES